MAIDTATLEISELEKYILLLVYVDDEPIYGRQKLQVLMYMLGAPYPEIREWCNFTIKDDGPYSVVLDDTLKRLVHMNILVEKDDTIQLAKHSIEYARIIGEEKGGFPEVPDLLEPKMSWVFHNYKDTLNDVTIPEMLSYMYCEYPDMAKGSKTYEKLKPDIEEHIFSMIAKENLSGGRGGDLLGETVYDMQRKMLDRGLLKLEL